MEGQQKQTQKKKRRFPWKRAIAALVASLLLSAAAILLILSTEHVIAAYWLVVIPSIFAVIALLIPLYQWLFPISPEVPSNPPQSPSLAESAAQNKQTKQSTNIWNVPYRSNPFFTGREELLKQLYDNFMNRKETALPQAISGLGGIGKTQIAVEYAYRHRDEYHAVLWVNAATRDTLITNFLDLARRLNLHEKDEQDQTIIVKAVLQWFKTHTQWLLILDNADNLALVREFLPPTTGGHVLLTTSAQAIGGLAQRLEVEIMELDMGALFLLRRADLIAKDAPLQAASPTDAMTAREITEELGGLPLALDQAGAYIEENRCSLTDYQRLFKSSHANLLAKRRGFLDDHPLPVATTWSLSFQKIKTANRAAATLLQWSAFLAPNAIPVEMITNSRGPRAIGFFFALKVSDLLRLNEAMELLLGYSLIYRNSENNTFSVHRLVQVVLRDQMSRGRQIKWAKRSVRAVNLAFPDVTDIALWKQCERLIPHALSCADLIKEYTLDFLEAASLLNKSGFYFHDHGQYEQAELLYQRALAIRENQLGLTATSLNNLAALYKAQGKYDEAEPLYQHALAIREKQLGSEHPDTAVNLNNLAGLYEAQGKYNEAEPLYQHALAIYEQQLGPLHPDTQIFRRNYVVLLRAMGRDAEAVVLETKYMQSS